MLHERIGISAWVTQRVDLAERHFEEAVALQAGVGDRVAEARTVAEFGRALLSFFHFEPALALLVEASERFKDLDDGPTLARLEGQLARAWYLNDDAAQAVVVADRVLPLAERHDLVEIVADTLVTRGSALVALGRRYEGIGAVETAQRLAATHSITSTEHRALNNLSSLLSRDDPRAALDAARTGLAMSRRLGVKSFHLLENARESAIRLGQWDWIVGELAAVLEDETDVLGRTTALAGTSVIRTLRGMPIADLVAELEAIPMSEDDTVKPVALAELGAWVAFADGRFEDSRARSLEMSRLFYQNRQEARLFAGRSPSLPGTPRPRKRTSLRR